MKRTASSAAPKSSTPARNARVAAVVKKAIDRELIPAGVKLIDFRAPTGAERARAQELERMARERVSRRKAAA